MKIPLEADQLVVHSTVEGLTDAFSALLMSLFTL